MPRKTRAAQKAAVEEPIAGEEEQQQEEASEEVATAPEAASKEASTSKAATAADESAEAERPKGKDRSRGKGKAATAAAAVQEEEGEQPAGAVAGEAQAEAEEAAEAAIIAPTPVAEEEAEEAAASNSQAVATDKTKLTMEQRREKMNALKKKMAQSSTQNRRDLALDKQARSNNVRDATNSRKLAKAEQTLDRIDAEERGEDWERQRNWKYTIEDGERWEEMQARGEESKDKGIIDANGLAARSYARGLKSFKPDIKSYQKAAEGSSAGPSSSSSTSLIRRGGAGDAASNQQVVRKEDVYAGVNSLSYGDHRPNDTAIDRVVSHMNMETDVRKKRSRKRPAEEGGEVTYINEKNQHFNKKIGRYFDEYTQEIRDNFERGTAL